MKASECLNINTRSIYRANATAMNGLNQSITGYLHVKKFWSMIDESFKNLLVFKGEDKPSRIVHGIVCKILSATCSV